MVSGFVAGWMLVTGVLVITKMEVAPMSAIACVLTNTSALGMPCRSAEAMLFTRDLFDVTTVALSLTFTLGLPGSKA